MKCVSPNEMMVLSLIRITHAKGKVDQNGYLIRKHSYAERIDRRSIVIPLLVIG